MADHGKDADGKALEGLMRFAGRHALRLGEGEVEVGRLALLRGDGAMRPVAAAVLRHALAAGLLARDAEALSVTDSGRAWLRRRLSGADDAFGAQHRDEETAERMVEGERQRVRFNHAESPLGALARLKDRQGGLFLPCDAVEAGERLHADFMRGQLQPRVTASWEPRLSSRNDGGRGGMADLADSVIAARSRVARAVDAIGPELSGVALDVCCFMKGLETVERERQWPARSAKLMLRTALLALSRHYAPPARPQRASTRHWGAEDFRPEIRV